MSFYELKERLTLPNSHFFRYIQLRHAFYSQFGREPLNLDPSDLELLTRSDSLVIPVSSIYKDLFQETGTLMEPCRLPWEAVAPVLDGDDWDDMWGDRVSIPSLYQKLFHSLQTPT